MTDEESFSSYTVLYGGCFISTHNVVLNIEIVVVMLCCNTSL